MTFGEKLKQKREEKGLTQTELALEVGVTQSAIVRFENDTRIPTIPMAKQFAKALDCEPTEFI